MDDFLNNNKKKNVRQHDSAINKTLLISVGLAHGYSYSVALSPVIPLLSSALAALFT